MQEPATVYLIDDDEAVRDSLAWVIRSAGYRVRSFASAEEFLDRTETDAFGCLVLDMRMPGMSGLALQRRLLERREGMPIIFISGHASVPEAVRAMHGGAVDFLTKPLNNQDLLDRIRTALEKEHSRQVEQQERGQLQARLARLSAREREVLDRVVAGKTNRAIAAELNISVKTVDAHRARVMEKMRAGSLAELVHLMHLV